MTTTQRPAYRPGSLMEQALRYAPELHTQREAIIGRLRSARLDGNHGLAEHYDRCIVDTEEQIRARLREVDEWA